MAKLSNAAPASFEQPPSLYNLAQAQQPPGLFNFPQPTQPQGFNFPQATQPQGLFNFPQTQQPPGLFNFIPAQPPAANLYNNVPVAPTDNILYNFVQALPPQPPPSSYDADCQIVFDTFWNSVQQAQAFFNSKVDLGELFQKPLFNSPVDPPSPVELHPADLPQLEFGKILEPLSTEPSATSATSNSESPITLNNLIEEFENAKDVEIAMSGYELAWQRILEFDWPAYYTRCEILGVEKEYVDGLYKYWEEQIAEYSNLKNFESKIKAKKEKQGFKISAIELKEEEEDIDIVSVHQEVNPDCKCRFMAVNSKHACKKYFDSKN